MTIDELRKQIKANGHKGWRVIIGAYANKGEVTAHKSFPSIRFTLRGPPSSVLNEINHIESL